MKYSFDAKIEKKENGYSIALPFNIWEVSKHRDEVGAELYVGEKILPCKLLPLEKGKYELHLDEKMITDVDIEDLGQILLRIPATLIKVKRESPYTLENPIRKIDNIDIVIQPEDGLCGQACVAMLAGVSIADVMDMMECREWQATMGRMISALNYYGIAHSGIIRFTDGRDVELPKCCIMMERMGRFSHYLLYFDGKFYDPNLGVLDTYDMSKLLGYLEVICE